MIERFKVYKKYEFKNKKDQITGVFEKDGEFFMYLEKSDDFVKIPKEVYRIIKISLYSEKRKQRALKKVDFSLEKDSAKRKELEYKSEKRYQGTENSTSLINCHKTLFLPKKDKVDNFPEDKQCWSSEELNDIFDINERKFFENIDSFREYIKDVLKKEKFGVSQIYQYNMFDYGKNDIEEDSELMHSFFLGISEISEKIICFDKEGYDNGKFEIIDLKNIFDKYFSNTKDEGSYPKYSKKSFFGVMPYGEFEKKIDGGFSPI